MVNNNSPKGSDNLVDDLVGGQQPQPAPQQPPQQTFQRSRPIMTNRPAFRKPMRRGPVGRMRPAQGVVARPLVVDNRMIPDAQLPTESVSGVLEITSEGHGLLRPNFSPSDRDVYISSSQIRRFRLRPGDVVEGPARKPKENERYWGLLKVEKVNGKDFDEGLRRPDFDRLTPIFPKEKLVLETDKGSVAARVIDLVAPIGKGQRGLIVSPPKAGKTTILKDIAHGIAENSPKVHLMAVLVGERPEEVTDIRKSVKGEVAASNFDEAAERQTKVAEIALDRAKRLVELGNDVVILLDSITRLARAYNLAIPTSGRTLSGGFDPAALYPPKRFFGAARNFEPFKVEGKEVGGSLTIIGTALVDTGSRMDELIYEEFKGTGNMELHLSRKLQERRMFPAINLQRSGTRQEQLLFNEKDYEKIRTMRRMIDVLDDNEQTEVMLERLRKTKSNKEFLSSLGK
ncbi:transcription termination factor Rho [Candidatus Beckwithbacteria bacterium RIFCSPLOWO2_01_FULL_49_47]|nr:MAG: transcription termination factor Rho [Candidatus Beckwithbacteria bacterium RIFCSPHIGHO2_01_FULL_49_39]OGD50442.1 MAG: transcription termination factor Rho [Candidatus Beckwithbacteria bacterium RIFCSPHIGHO2_12_FULL_49_13]OGD52019.1 MAG: transcription termination factor Rho [Candidatus Beckwithbacteria bacterium RIFCSPHIGHO2_02_FULL_49_13]OGD58768.1 MAG: transcription termination factor Rho [Candidatus Beckwithbacteria bacterium RIFCSPLOWO2_02_FULL_49_12]OGD60145.1 MAG: transcription te